RRVVEVLVEAAGDGREYVVGDVVVARLLAAAVGRLLLSVGRLVGAFGGLLRVRCAVHHCSSCVSVADAVSAGFRSASACAGPAGCTSGTDASAVASGVASFASPGSMSCAVVTRWPRMSASGSAGERGTLGGSMPYSANHWSLVEPAPVAVEPGERAPEGAAARLRRSCSWVLMGPTIGSPVV